MTEKEHIQAMLDEISKPLDELRIKAMSIGLKLSGLGQIKDGIKQMTIALEKSEGPKGLGPKKRLALEEEEALTRSCASKKRYRSPEAAGTAATFAHNNGSTDILRVYQCPLCDGFHLTHVVIPSFSEQVDKGART